MDMKNFFGWVQGVRANGAGKANWHAAQNMTGEMSQKGWRPEAKSVEDVYLSMHGDKKTVDKPEN